MLGKLFRRCRRSATRTGMKLSSVRSGSSCLHGERLEPRQLLAADVVINEFMAANQSTLQDDFRVSSDWIELWNRGDEAAALSDYYLTDDPDNLSKWAFPSNATLDPGQYTVVFASGLDTIDGSGSLHTNFQLSADGGYLALVDRESQILSEYGQGGRDYPAQFGDVSYGLQDEGLVGFLLTPTPGNPNGSEVANTGPQIKNVTDRMGSWSNTDDIIVRANVDRRYGDVATVNLTWRTNYVDETIQVMRDDGLGGDTVAGDGEYAAVIPEEASDAGDMVRWYVTATDADGRMSEAPAFLDSSGRDQSPRYFGTAIADTTVSSQLDVLQWFIEPGQERRANSTRGTRSSLYFKGQLYDNVFVRVRGGSSAGLPKKSYKFDFNTANAFRFDDASGRVREINLNTTYTNKDYLRQALAFETYDTAGVAGSVAKPVRIEQNGEFFSVAMMIEQPDADLLSREGMDPDGALYKMFNKFTSGRSGVEKKTRQYEKNDDLTDFVDAINSLTGDALKNYVFDNINIPAVLNYLATTVIIQNNDQMAKNYFLYRDSDGTGEWEFLPWDLDLTFGLHFMSNDSILDDVIWADKDAFVTFAGAKIWPSHPFVGDQDHPANRSWNRLIDALYKVPEFREMHLRRLRTLMDELLQAPGTPTEDLYFESRLDEYVEQIAADAQQDYDTWANPWKWGEDLTLDQAIQRLKDEYLAVRRNHLYETHGVDNPNAGDDLAGIPNAQRQDLLVNLGAAIDYAPTSGDANEEYMTIVNPNADAVDLSGWQISGAIEHTLVKGTVIPAGGTLYLSPNVRAFRSRQTGPSGDQGLLVQQVRGSLSNAGGQLRLDDREGRSVSQIEYEGIGASSQDNLRITEINYNPYGAMPQFGEVDTDNDGFEFIEITNSGESSITLAGAKLAEIIIDGDRQGITYEFASGQLAPGERLLIVKNTSVFESRYGTGFNVVGEFLGKLSNGGETLTLLDTANDIIQQFAYGDDGTWPALADGGGATLEMIDGQQDAKDPANWRASDRFGGSPGAMNDAIAHDIVINEILSATVNPALDQLELYNAGDLPVDVSGWYLSDSQDVQKFRIPAGQPILAPGDYLVLDEAALGFGFKGSRPDDVRLVAAADGRPTRFADYVQFPAAPNGVSFGRWPNGSGSLVPMRNTTFGAANAGPAGGLPGDLNNDLTLDAADIDLFCQSLNGPQPNDAADFDGNGMVDQDDLTLLVGDFMGSAVGDANLDGVFNSADLVLVFQAGQYEDAVPGNSIWATGDWNCDGDFTTQDLVFAFQRGEYSTA